MLGAPLPVVLKVRAQLLIALQNPTQLALKIHEHLFATLQMGGFQLGALELIPRASGQRYFLLEPGKLDDKSFSVES